MFSIFNGIYNWDVGVVFRVEYLLNEVAIYGPYKLPLGRTYIRGHYLVILDRIEFVNAIYHVSKAVDEVEQNPQQIVERNSLFEVDIIGVVCSPDT